MLRFLYPPIRLLAISLFFAVTTYAQAALSVDPSGKAILTIYSYSSFMSEWGPGAKIKAGFEAQCDCHVNIVSIGDGVTILNRLKLEGSRTKADVLLGLDNNLIASARAANLVQNHKITTNKNLTIDWQESDFIPYDYGYFAFIYNKENIQSPPSSLQELVSNEQNWKIVYQDPRTSTPGLGLLLWMQYVYADDVPQAWQALAKNTLTVTKGWSEAYNLFLKGEADFVLSYNTSPVVHISNDNDYRYKAAIFTEGHYRQIEVAAISQYSKQFLLAQQFLNYLLTPEVQSQLVEKNIMYPVIDIPLPEAYQHINRINKVLSFTSQQVEQNQKKWIRQWQDAVSR